MKQELFKQAIVEFDKANSLDPNLITIGDEQKPRELAYSEWLSDWVQRLNPNASEPLQLAARCQHLKRWEIPRSKYPDGLKGYTKWKKELAEFHAQEGEKILKKIGYDPATIERVKEINLKKNLKSDSEVQTIEDALCLVTLAYQIEDFSKKHSDEKMIEIIRKTWGKMSNKAREEALKLKYSERVLSLIQKAI
ncbi:MAG TPA: DUF4202 domain-containing protein [Leptospiraceae bacterium]|nr:DUF4202 domain-containing protein [Leptospiraceae bacterium]HMW07327.1 DUF4202 domain-containing protein [Leptospiraceae bacterium]HMY32965.1 DUF4202 domain-containing protein [Leptospiraceae bacterium]HMZ64579.1 DUF4202 domain-containing protein [Leptospiraceae bacterium]HNA08184.1 DUF4202 domain-containing protein [Leptospiraceae bacterium]